MLRFRPSKSASAGYHYFEKSDAGLDANDLHNEVGGKAASLLGLSKIPDFDQFKNLLHGNDPHTGEQLTAQLHPGRISYWDVTASIPKGVTVALEFGDNRIHEALWAANRETMRELESFMTTRVRQGGKLEDRVTGNMAWYSFEHPETRPSREDGKPDPDRHIHNVIINVTWDKAEQQWKAIKFRPVMDLRKWFDRRFDQRLARKLTDLGYSVETKFRQGKYYSWDIKGIPMSVVQKFSRRTAEVEKLAAKLKIENPRAKDKLGATSRQLKREDMSLEDYRKYWQSRITPLEAQRISDCIGDAEAGVNSAPSNTVDKAVDYAIRDQFYRNSVVPLKDMEIAAMERSMGAAKPEEIAPELRKQGVLEKDGEATTKEVLEQEGRILHFARESRGTMRPLGALVRQKENTSLSPEQQALFDKIMASSDQVQLAVADAGTGKTSTLKPLVAAIERQAGKPVEILAEWTSASRGVLRDEGFSRADTIASFLKSEKRQQAVKNGVIIVDEGSQIGIDHLEGLCNVAKEQNARLIIFADPKQHRSVGRDGNMMRVLETHAGLPVGRLKEIWRQKDPKYKQAVEAIARGDILKGHDILTKMGAVQYAEPDSIVGKLADAYLRNRDNSLVVAPTHAVGDAIAEAIRFRLHKEGKLGEEERSFVQLRNLGWSTAQKADLNGYDGNEVIQFFHNTGPFKAGGRSGVGELLAVQERHYARKRGPRPQRSPFDAEHFSVYAPGQIKLSPGDLIRITAGGKTLDGKQIDNGSVFTVQGFTDKGDIALTNGRVIGKGFGHIAHAYTSTSYGAQGKTVDHVLVAMTRQTAPALSAAQFYVSASRGRKSATIFSDMQPAEMRELIQKQDDRKSATDLMNPKKEKKEPILNDLARRAREAVVRLLYEQQQYAIPPEIPRHKIERSGYDR